MNQEQNRVLLIAKLLEPVSMIHPYGDLYIFINIVIIVFIVWIPVLPRSICHDYYHGCLGRRVPKFTM